MFHAPFFVFGLWAHGTTVHNPAYQHWKSIVVAIPWIIPPDPVVRLNQFLHFYSNTLSRVRSGYMPTRVACMVALLATMQGSRSRHEQPDSPIAPLIVRSLEPCGGLSYRQPIVERNNRAVDLGYGGSFFQIVRQH